MFTAWRRWLACSLCVLLGALGAGCGGSSRRTGRPLGYVSTGPIESIAGGGFSGYALLTDGRVWGWGDDLEGQIGTGGAWQLSATPVEIPGLREVVAIAGGQNTAYALRRDGTVWAWGDDVQDELGDDGSSPRQIPKRIRLPGEIVAIEAGAFSEYALRRDGTVWAWGSNSFLQLGTGGAIVPSGIPRRVDRLAAIVAIAAGSGDGYALDRDGRVWAWGGVGGSRQSHSGVAVSTDDGDDLLAIRRVLSSTQEETSMPQVDVDGIDDHLRRARGGRAASADPLHVCGPRCPRSRFSPHI